MSLFNFDKKAEEFDVLKKNAAIAIMARTKQYFADSFVKEELGGVKWAEVSRRIAGSPFNAKQVVGGRNKASGKPFVTDQGDDYATRKILSGTTGRLKYKTEKADSSITQDGTTSVMTNPLEYAEAINEGNEYMQARPFMKQTDELTEIQLAILKNETGKIWNKS